MLISDYIVSLGLAISIGLVVAFRAGQQAREINALNLEDKVNELTINALKENIVSRLENLLRVYRETTPGLNVELPPLHDVTERLFFVDERVSLLHIHNIYCDLIYQGTQSEYFVQALQFLGFESSISFWITGLSVRSFLMEDQPPE